MNNQTNDVSIIIPTYKERENISPLLQRILSVIETNHIRAEIIVVDDNSRDGTLDETKKYPVRCIVREVQKGLAAACIDGFKQAAGSVILVIDADLQHPPETIPVLIQEIQNGTDIAIASRYVSGGRIIQWSWHRKISSKCAGWFSNLLLPQLNHIKDKESGFFAFRKEVIQGAGLQPEGFKILLEILALGHYKKVKEIGYTFGERAAGKSKLSFTVIFAFLDQIIRLSKAVKKREHA